MKKTSRWLAAAFLLVFLVSIAFLFHDFWYAILIRPLTLFVWAFIRLISSVDQSIYWYLLIALIFFLAFRLIPSRPEPQEKILYDDRQIVVRGVDYWRTAIREREKNEILRQNIKELIIAALATRDRADPSAVRDDLNNQKLPLPNFIYEYLFPAAAQKNLLNRIRTGLLNTLPRWLLQRIDPDGTKRNPSIPQILDWLETYLEVNHDPNN